MKRSTLITLIFFLSSFIGVAVWKAGGEEAESAASNKMTDEKRQKITSFWDTYHEATELRVEKDFAEAARLYREALQLRPEHEESLYYLGNSLFEQGKYIEAARLYRKLIEINPRSQRAYSQLGVTLMIDHPGAPTDLQASRRAFERNAELDPEESGPYLRLGNVALREGKLEEAYTYFLQAAGFASPEGAFRAGYVRFLQKKWTEAAEWFESVLATAQKESEIAARGAHHEGDTREGETERAMTPLLASATKSRAFLDWAEGAPKKRAEAPAGANSETRFALRDLSTASENTSAQAADFDEDGDEDLLLLSPLEVRLFERKESLLIENTCETLNEIRGATAAAAGDFDRDGRPDLAVVVKGALRLFRSEGSLSFEEIDFARDLIGEAPTDGVLFADLDGDGAADLVEWRKQSEDPLVLYRNRDGFLRTEQILSVTGHVTECAAGDLDGDGLVDLVVNRWKGPVEILRNRGEGRFESLGEVPGAGKVGGGGFSLLIFDYDRDGHLDLLLGERDDYARTLLGWLEPDTKVEFVSPRLFRGLEGMRFEEVTEKAGLNRGFGILDVSSADLNGDGWPDLLLANGSIDGQELQPGAVLLNLQGVFSAPVPVPAWSPANSEFVVTLDGPGRTLVYFNRIGLGFLQ